MDAQLPTTGTGDALVLHSWTSKRGNSCGTHVRNKYCTIDGGYGLGWVTGWGSLTFEDDVRLGLTAPQACCGCGGGSTT